jgi:staphyloferrin B biosynthesis citrate synthase
MEPNRVRMRLAEGKLALNSHSHLRDAAVVEILGLAGYDAVTIDLEHTAFDLSLVQHMFLAAERVGITPIVRIPVGAWSTVTVLLDAGAQGIQVPHVTERSIAERAVAAVKYPPQGSRGAIGVSRAARYGTVPWSDHVRTSNERILLNLMIEDTAGLDNLEAIASVEGVDFIIVGLHDLAESMAIRSPDDPRLRAIVEEIATRLQRLGKAQLGLTVGHPMLQLSVGDLKHLHSAFCTVAPAVERRMLTVLMGLVDGIRREENLA